MKAGFAIATILCLVCSMVAPVSAVSADTEAETSLSKASTQSVGPPEIQLTGEDDGESVRLRIQVSPREYNVTEMRFSMAGSDWTVQRTQGLEELELSGSNGRGYAWDGVSANVDFILEANSTDAVTQSESGAVYAAPWISVIWTQPGVGEQTGLLTDPGGSSLQTSDLTTYQLTRDYILTGDSFGGRLTTSDSVDVYASGSVSRSDAELAAAVLDRFSGEYQTDGRPVSVVIMESSEQESIRYHPAGQGYMIDSSMVAGGAPNELLLGYLSVTQSVQSEDSARWFSRSAPLYLSVVYGYKYQLISEDNAREYLSRGNEFQGILVEPDSWSSNGAFIGRGVHVLNSLDRYLETNSGSDARVSDLYTAFRQSDTAWTDDMIVQRLGEISSENTSSWLDEYQSGTSVPVASPPRVYGERIDVRSSIESNADTSSESGQQQETITPRQPDSTVTGTPVDAGGDDGGFFSSFPVLPVFLIASILYILVYVHRRIQ